MLPMLLFNVVSSLVVDKAQDLAKEHVEKMIDDILPDDAKEELDELKGIVQKNRGTQQTQDELISRLDKKKNENFILEMSKKIPIYGTPIFSYGRSYFSCFS